MSNRGELSVLACRSGKEFGERVVSELSDIVGKTQDAGAGISEDFKVELCPTRTIDFRNGEMDVEILRGIRGKDVYLIQCCDDPSSSRSINDNIMEMLIYVDAIVRGQPAHITLVTPNYPYARKDAATGRDAISSKLIADLIHAAGVQQIMIVDLHSRQVQGNFPRTMGFDNLNIYSLTVDYLKKYFDNATGDVVIVSPDAGGAKRARDVAEYFGCRWALSEKTRTAPGEVGDVYIMDKVSGLRAVILDDIIDSGNTTEKTVEALQKKRVNDILVYCTHPIFSNPATEILSRLHRDGKIVRVVGTDTIPHPGNYLEKNTWFHQISVAPLVAHAVYRVNRQDSVSELYTPQRR